MLKIKCLSVGRRTIDHPPNKLDVVRMHPVEHDFNRGPGRGVVLKYSIALLGPENYSACDGPAKTASVAKPLRLRQIGLALSQCVFGSLSIFDINGRSIPPDDVAGLVAQRHGAPQEPTIFPVNATQARFCLDVVRRGPVPYSARGRISDSRPILGMVCIDKVPTARLLQS